MYKNRGQKWERLENLQSTPSWWERTQHTTVLSLPHLLQCLVRPSLSVCGAWIERVDVQVRTHPLLFPLVQLLPAVGPGLYVPRSHSQTPSPSFTLGIPGSALLLRWGQTRVENCTDPDNELLLQDGIWVGGPSFEHCRLHDSEEETGWRGSEYPLQCMGPRAGAQVLLIHIQ